MNPTPDELLERSQWDFFWAPPDAAIVDRPELLYISCRRDLTYLNMVTRVRAGAEQLPVLIDEVVQSHRGRRSRWPVLWNRQRDILEARLGSAEYAPGQHHDAYAITPQSYKKRPVSAIVVERVDTIERLRNSHAVSSAAFGDEQLVETDVGKLHQELATCTGPTARVHRFVAYDATSGQPISAGAINLYPSLGFGFLWGGGTIPEARGRGAYSAVVASRLDYARRQGLHLVGLYARIDTSAPIVAAQGFQRHGRMVYWERPPHR